MSGTGAGVNQKENKQMVIGDIRDVNISQNSDDAGHNPNEIISAQTADHNELTRALVRKHPSCAVHANIISDGEKSEVTKNLPRKSMQYQGFNRFAVRIPRYERIIGWLEILSTGLPTCEKTNLMLAVVFHIDISHPCLAMRCLSDNHQHY